MDPAQWPGIVEMIEGWWDTSLPAKTATMWYAELRHYGEDRVTNALRGIATSSTSPFLPPLGLVLQRIRVDGHGLPEHLWAPHREAMYARFKQSNDQFQLTTGGGKTDEELEAYFSPGRMCPDTDGCGAVALSIDDVRCHYCGAEFVEDHRPPELGGPVMRNGKLLAAGTQETGLATL